MHPFDRIRSTAFALRAGAICSISALLIVVGCSNGTSSSSTTTTTSVYPAIYKAAAWTGAATVSYSGTCTMTIQSTGVPAYHDSYYLAPVSTAYPTVVATTPLSGMQLSVQPYTPGSIKSSSATLNICPTKASSTTATSQGVIGYMLNGEPLYNAYEATSTAALSDNVSYSFTTNGTTYTAKFLDDCNSHATPLSMTYSWHYHGIPLCYVSTVDGSSGPSHMIGVALDGFPIYGGRDINGAIITTSQLDACNGITSVTPEFSTATYHYVLPYNTTSKYSSLNCYTGSVSGVTTAAMKKYACDPTKMKDSLQYNLHPMVPTRKKNEPMTM